MVNKIRRLFRPVLGVALFILIWHLLTLGNKRTDIPGPWLTLQGLFELFRQGILVKNIVASVFRVAWGFLLATLIGIPLGVGLGRFPELNQLFNPPVQLLRPISPIAWLPIATLLFGPVRWFEPSDVAAIFLIFLSSFFTITTATASAIATVDQKFLRSASNFGVKGVALVTDVLLPASLPQILTGLRLALGISWVVVVAAEMLGVQSGLGYQVNDARNNLRYDLVVAAMVLIGLIGLVLDTMMRALEERALRRRGILRR
ncbi:MAG: ABC transporter permease [Acidobacteria bacterium]|nr:ABC transporter permease [Acidobacteriota bacterium]MCG3194167.1 Bicarbonate transport system permease protein CmpB [Thermoanaerobaculia bacterium]